MSEDAGWYQIGGSHDLRMGIQPWDLVDHWSNAQKIGYYRGNALKYLLRMGSKGAALEDVRKAKHYTAKLAQVLRGIERANKKPHKRSAR